MPHKKDMPAQECPRLDTDNIVESPEKVRSANIVRDESRSNVDSEGNQKEMQENIEAALPKEKLFLTELPQEEDQTQEVVESYNTKDLSISEEKSTFKHQKLSSVSSRTEKPAEETQHLEHRPEEHPSSDTQEIAPYQGKTEDHESDNGSENIEESLTQGTHRSKPVEVTAQNLSHLEITSPLHGDTAKNVNQDCSEAEEQTHQEGVAESEKVCASPLNEAKISHAANISFTKETEKPVMR